MRVVVDWSGNIIFSILGSISQHSFPFGQTQTIIQKFYNEMFLILFRTGAFWNSFSLISIKIVTRNGLNWFYFSLQASRNFFFIIVFKFVLDWLQLLYSAQWCTVCTKTCTEPPKHAAMNLIAKLYGLNPIFPVPVPFCYVSLKQNTLIWVTVLDQDRFLSIPRWALPIFL